MYINEIEEKDEGMNHLELLKKYMTVLRYVEGVTFTDMCQDEYTAEEHKELVRIAHEVEAEYVKEKG